ncbi:MAG: sigma 54-interacting transcriptional regulator [Bacteriovoracaceae bacterium]|nr:sigma 54-interacting transcriptional regulator [Bacteriovoracaceae bacterium]
MIDWNTIKDLHVISKLEEIIGNWFGVELIYTNEHGKIQNSIHDKNYEFKNHFFKVQTHISHGLEYLNSDIEKMFEKFEQGEHGTLITESFFQGVKTVCVPIIHESELLGCVFAYPYVKDDFTSEESDALVKKLVECGSSTDDAKSAVSHLKKLNLQEKEYLKELVSLVVHEIITFHQEISKRENMIKDLNSELGSKYRYHNMIGKAKSMQVVYHLLDKISKSESTILIQGENGTGKELVAKAIHYASPRKDMVFLAQNCSAFNDNLLDSELFGHVRGAFTGAVKDKKGLFEMANGGTLFLDEIGDTSLAMQVKLLRILQEGTFLPVGATSPKKVSVRIIAATNKPLKEMIQKGEFREDLYYRLNVINVTLPPLRERREDIPLLIEYFVEKRCAEMGLPTKQFSKKCLEKLIDYSWPGNVRELENEVERLVVLAGEDKMITPEILSGKMMEVSDNFPGVKGVRTTGKLKDALEELEALMIREGLKRCNYNKSKLAKELGISRAGLIMKVEKYGFDKRTKFAVNESEED